MIDLNHLNKYRNHPVEAKMYGPATSAHYAVAGCFIIPFKGSRRGLAVIASSGIIKGSEGWDHVSVSTLAACPTWDMMCKVKTMFFEPSDVCFQLHPAEAENISNHRYCLHIWRNIHTTIPLPPPSMVGYQSVGDVTGTRFASELLDDIRNPIFTKV